MGIREGGQREEGCEKKLFDVKKKQGERETGRGENKDLPGVSPWSKVQQAREKRVSAKRIFHTQTKIPFPQKGIRDLQREKEKIE